jgi:hypothetical protein
LAWINNNDNELACAQLSIQDEARFRKWILVDLPVLRC